MDVNILRVCRACTYVHVLAQALFAERQWSGTRVGGVGGQRSICSNPSSCQSVSLLAARRWWLPRVNALDECPLERRVTVGKTDHRETGGETSPKHPPRTAPPHPPHCGMTLCVQYEALTATAGSDTCHCEVNHLKPVSTVVPHRTVTSGTAAANYNILWRGRGRIRGNLHTTLLVVSVRLCFRVVVLI